MKELKEKLLGLGVFIDNYYLDLYCTLISSNLERKKEKGITQRHHIIPRAYYKDNDLQVDNTKANIVNLIFKDHILAHYYLALCSKESLFRAKMVYGINRIISGGNGLGYNLDSLDLESFINALDELQALYEESSLVRSLCTSEAMKGRAQPEEVRLKISQSNKGKVYSAESRKRMSEAHSGKDLSEEHKRKISESCRGRKNPGASRKHSPEEIEARRQKLLGRTVSEETRRKISEAKKGKQINFSDEALRKIGAAHKGVSPTNKGMPSAIKGKKAIYNKNTNVSKYVYPEEISTYVEAGWEIGKIKPRMKANN